MAFFRKRLREYVPRLSLRSKPKKKKKKKAPGKKRTAKKRPTVPGSPVLSSATDRYLDRYQEKFGGTRAAAREALAQMLYGPKAASSADASPSKGTQRRKKKKKRTAKKRPSKKKVTRKKKRTAKKRTAKKRTVKKRAAKKRTAKKRPKPEAVKGDGVNSRKVYLQAGENYRWSLRFDNVPTKAVRQTLLTRYRLVGSEVSHDGLDPLIMSVLLPQKKHGVMRTNVRKKAPERGAPDLTLTVENVWHV